MIRNNLQLYADRVIPEKPDILNGLPHYYYQETITGDSIMSKSIPLTKGQFAIVDNEDYEALVKFKWRAYYDGWNWYAMRACRCPIVRQQHTIQMHRVVINAQQGQEVDHLNGNGLHNYKGNLRFCNRSQNNANRKKRCTCSSKYKGVYWNKIIGKWCVRIKHNQKSIWLGYYDNEIEVAQRYDYKAKELVGEFACTNFKENCNDF